MKPKKGVINFLKMCRQMNRDQALLDMLIIEEDDTLETCTGCNWQEEPNGTQLSIKNASNAGRKNLSNFALSNSQLKTFTMGTNITNDFEAFKNSDRFKGFVYFLYCEGHFKIGYTSTTIKSRLINMVTGNPFAIKVALVIGYKSIEGAKCTEKQLHTKYAGKRGKGEWFSLTWGDVRSLAYTYKDLIVEDNINALDIERKPFYIDFRRVETGLKNIVIQNNSLFESPVGREITSVKDDNMKELTNFDITWLIVKLQEYQKKIYER